jgi:Caspase domain/Domain of unknown function (DUF4384)
MKNIFVPLLLAFSVCSFAQQTSSDYRHALIIGVSEYQNPQIPTLTGVPYDMESAKKIALAMGIPESNISYLKNSDATKSNILNELQKMGNSASEGSREFVYFSGHGTRYQDYSAGGCVEGLYSYDGQAITNKEFATASKKLIASADKVITMIDACHSEGVVPPKNSTRSIAISLKPKFFLDKSGGTDNACAKPANQRTRGLVAESTRIGALQENVVQITSSRPDEVSFDEPGKGGIATQAVRDCLLGKGKDLDNSGGVSIEEVQQCAQEIINSKLQNQIDYTPHHVTVTGNRNLIPVHKPKPPAAVAEPTPAPSQPIQVDQPPAVAVALVQAPTKPEDRPTQQSLVTTVESSKPQNQPQSLASNSSVAQAQKPQELANSHPLANHAATTPENQTDTHKLQVTPPAVKPPKEEPALASLATLKDIQKQGNPKREVLVTLNKPTLKIGKDSLDLTIKSNHDGYVYLVLLGSDSNSFYVLYPNGLDKDNRIRAGETLRVPKADWQVQAAGPVGTDNLLVMVADSPRKLDTLTMAKSTATEPFTYALNDLGGRAALIDFLTGSGVDGKSESFGAKIVSVKEVK